MCLSFAGWVDVQSCHNEASTRCVYCCRNERCIVGIRYVSIEGGIPGLKVFSVLFDRVLWWDNNQSNCSANQKIRSALLNLKQDLSVCGRNDPMNWCLTRFWSPNYELMVDLLAISHHILDPTPHIRTSPFKRI
jgi:hypothetical protein